jgi:hypothetical protein
MKGHTMLTTKREQFNHPAAWMRALLAVQSSMASSQKGFLGSRRNSLRVPRWVIRKATRASIRENHTNYRSLP